MEFAPDAQRMRKKLAATDRPYVVLKAAVSLDGKIATAGGESQWITGEPAREAAHQLRAAHDGVMVGIGTVLADDPQLTCRAGSGREKQRQPARVVLDSRARIPPASRCLAADGVRRLVVVGGAAPPAAAEGLRAQGVEVVACPGMRPAAAAFLPALRTAGLCSLLVEGGGEVHANLIANGEADELLLFFAGLVMGDGGARGWCAALGVDRLAGLPRLRLSPPRMVGEDVVVHGFFLPRHENP